MGQRSKKWARLRDGKPAAGVRYGSKPHPPRPLHPTVSSPEFDKNKPSFLLLLPSELLMDIIGHLRSSKDLRSLQQTHPIFDDILTGPFSNSLLSEIAIRKWKSMGGLPLLDVLCNRTANPRLRQSFLVETKKKRSYYGFDLYAEFGKGQSWPSYSSTLADSVRPGAKYEVPVGLAVLEQMDTIEEKVIHPLLTFNDEPLPLKVKAKVQHRAYWHLKKSTIKHALFLLFGAFKHYNRCYAPGETHVKELGIASTGKYDNWYCGYWNEGFMKEFDLVNHWRILAVGFPMYMYGSNDESNLEVVKRLNSHLVMIWRVRIMTVWTQTVQAGFADEVLEDAESLFALSIPPAKYPEYYDIVSPEGLDFYDIVGSDLEDSFNLRHVEENLWMSLPSSRKFQKTIDLLERLSKVHKCALASTKLSRADPQEIITSNVNHTFKEVPGVRIANAVKSFRYTSKGRSLGDIDPLQRNSIARAI